MPLLTDTDSPFLAVLGLLYFLLHCGGFRRLGVGASDLIIDVALLKNIEQGLWLPMQCKWGFCRLQETTSLT